MALTREQLNQTLENIEARLEYDGIRVKVMHAMHTQKDGFAVLHASLFTRKKIIEHVAHPFARQEFLILQRTANTLTMGKGVGSSTVRVQFARCGNIGTDIRVTVFTPAR